jgi:hypothetical protein
MRMRVLKADDCDYSILKLLISEHRIDGCGAKEESSA